MPPPPTPAKSYSQDSTWSKLLEEDPESFTGLGQTSLWPMLQAASKLEEDDDDSDETDSAESSSINSQPGKKHRAPPDFHDAEPTSIGAGDTSFYDRLGKLCAISYNMPALPYTET